MIKIISAHSTYGGSTTAFINLTNLFNKNGIPCKFYGPHDWHLNKCNAGKLADYRPEPDDRVIVHYMNLAERIPSRNVILSVHEQNVFPLKNVNLAAYDKIHYVSNHQLEYHQVDKDYFILGNVMDDLKRNQKPETPTAGIIGTIDPNKQVHVSIANALRDGFKKIKIYGNIGNEAYYTLKVLPYLNAYKGVVTHEGFCENKQEMYDSITDVYFSSEMECLPYVIGECRMTGTRLHTLKGKNYTKGNYEFDNNKILETWLKELDL